LLMAFVGGAGVFGGPIIGAILISFLQTFLSDVTPAWQLYFGLLFIVVVLFSPGGIAGWVMLHEDVAKRGDIWRLLPAYGLVAIPIVAAILGLIMAIELTHRIYVEAQQQGSVMNLFGFSVDAASFVPWIVAGGLFVAGIIGLKLLWPRVSAAWNDIHARRLKKVVA
jgi:branched-chain amino acid transport system permease protein